MPPRLLSLGPTFRLNHDIASQLTLFRTSDNQPDKREYAKSGVVSKVTLFQYFLQTRNQL
jgi:hypothetical protein